MENDKSCLPMAFHQLASYEMNEVMCVCFLDLWFWINPDSRYLQASLDIGDHYLPSTDLANRLLCMSSLYIVTSSAHISIGNEFRPHVVCESEL